MLILIFALGCMAGCGNNVRDTASDEKSLTQEETSSNPKFATVKSKGMVKVLKAGKGKTVKNTVMATDGSNVKKIVKLKIK